jgi:predicted GNAT family acetyltransferase
MPNAVHNNRALRRYELAVDGGTAILAYRNDGGVVALLHTQVPDELRGRGIGSTLVRGALEDIRQQGQKAIVRCPFITAFIAKHREFADLVAE